MLKTCKECSEEKEIGMFYRGQGECKECTKKRVRKNYSENIDYYRNYDKKRQKYSMDRMLSHRYNSLKSRCLKLRINHGYTCLGKEFLSREQWDVWCSENKNRKVFMRLYKKWVASGFKRSLTPSIDRINSAGGYNIENIQWLTLSDNCKKK